MKKVVFLLVSLFMASMLNAQDSSQLPNKNVKYFSTKDGAIQGYDPVAYFKENIAVKGDKKFMFPWNGADWFFKNQANIDSFKSSPEKYAPEFGGHCAYGVSENHLSPTDPMAFTIVNNKLYLNYSLKVKELWLNKRDERIIKANEYWPLLKK